MAAATWWQQIGGSAGRQWQNVRAADWRQQIGGSNLVAVAEWPGNSLAAATWRRRRIGKKPLAKQMIEIMKLKRLLKRLLMAMLFLATVGMAYAQGQGVAGQDAAAQEAAMQGATTQGAAGQGAAGQGAAVQEPAAQGPAAQGIAGQGAAAQEPATDTTSVGASQQLDSLLVGASIFDRLAEYNTEVNQIPQIREAFSKYIEQNSGKKRHGYRIRIFISNAQNARAQSLEVENSFKKLFPAIPTYRTPSNPYFKVTVGNYRSRSDAARALTIIKEEYPAAFMVKETIDYPEL